MKTAACVERNFGADPVLSKLVSRRYEAATGNPVVLVETGEASYGRA